MDWVNFKYPATLKLSSGTKLLLPSQVSQNLRQNRRINVHMRKRWGLLCNAFSAPVQVIVMFDRRFLRSSNLPVSICAGFGHHNPRGEQRRKGKHTLRTFRRVVELLILALRLKAGFLEALYLVGSALAKNLRFPEMVETHSHNPNASDRTPAGIVDGLASVGVL